MIYPQHLIDEALKTLRDPPALDYKALLQGPPRTSDSLLALQMASAGMGHSREVFRHAQAQEIERQHLLRQFKGDVRGIPLQLLMLNVRAMITEALTYAAKPPAGAENEDTVGFLGNICLLIFKLELFENACHDLQVFRDHRSNQVTLHDLSRGFEDECRGRGRFETSVLKRLYDRLDEQVHDLRDLFMLVYGQQKAWVLNPHDAHYESRRYDAVIEAAMDAALALECNFEDRVFGPLETTDVD